VPKPVYVLGLPLMAAMRTDAGGALIYDGPNLTADSSYRGQWLVHRLLAVRRCVLGFWVLAIVVSAPFAAQLVDATRFNFKPVPGTESYAAQLRIAADFPHLTYQDSEVVLISCAACPSESGGVIASGSADGNFTRYAFDVLRKQLNLLASRHPEWRFANTSALDFAGASFGAFSQKNPLLSSDNRTALFQFSWEVLPSQQQQALALFKTFSDAVDGLQDEAHRALDGYTLALTGPIALFQSTLDRTKSDLQSKDLFVLPVALLILACRVRSLRLALLTFLNVGMSVGVSYAIFLPVAKYALDISPLVPSVMVFLSIALSIDYSLFLFTRFGEEVQQGKTPHGALVPMLLRSGEVVCLSGSVLILCYLGVLLFPGSNISSIGLGASVSIFIAMAANLTLGPCVIATFPHFFGAGLGPSSRGHCHKFFKCTCGDGRRYQQRAWMWWGQKVTSCPCIVLVPLLAYGAMLPMCLQLFHYRESFDNSLMFPSGGTASAGYKRLLGMSSAGALAPMFVLQSGDVKSNEWFAQSCGLAARLLAVTAGQPYALRPQDMVGVAVLPSPLDPTQLVNLTWNSSHGALIPTAQELLERNFPIAGHDIGAEYRTLWAQLVSLENRSGIMRIQPNFDPYGPHMRPFVAALRGELARHRTASWQQHEGRRLHGTVMTQQLVIGPEVNGMTVASTAEEDRVVMNGEAKDEVLIFSPLLIVFDLMQVTYRRLPLVLCVVFTMCFVSIGVVFKAALVPLKLCFTVLVPLCMVYGTAVLVYQDGVLDSLGWHPLHGTGGLFWAQPIFTVTVLTGLALDYDVFLFARVLELRMQGFDNPAAVAGAMALTGPTITAAGLIMASAFGGLLLTDIPANNQTGFVMSFAVLIDTFVIRTCLVPAVLVLASKLNYWPRRLPAETYTLAHMKTVLSSADGEVALAAMVPPAVEGQ